MRTYYQEVIDDELKSHLEDMADDFIAQGMKPAEARQQALAEFGNVDAIKQELSFIHRPVRWLVTQPAVMAAGIYVAISIVFTGLFILSQGSLRGTSFEPLFLWWIFIGVIGLVLLISYWIVEYFGLESQRAVWYTAAWTHVVAIALTFVLDVDKFENNLHALFFSLLLIVGVRFVWRKIRARWKRLIIFTNSAIVIWAILTDRQLFDFVGQARCLFITPDNVPLTGALALCAQVGWSSPILFPLYGLIGVAIPLLGHFLIQFWRNAGSELYRKLVFTGALVLLPIAPLIARDVNNTGGVDVIPAKAQVYQAYWDILGRAPEQKDIDFYARTRAYEDIPRIQETLYNSTERKIKITLIYQEVLQRQPTPEEIDRFVQNRYAVQRIHDTLEQESAPVQQP